MLVEYFVNAPRLAAFTLNHHQSIFEKFNRLVSVRSFGQQIGGSNVPSKCSEAIIFDLFLILVRAHELALD